MTRATIWHPAAVWGLAITVLVALIWPPSTVIAASTARPFGDAKILAKVPKPGFPEGIAVKGNTVYVAGPATFGTTVLNEDGSKVWAFDIATGSLVAEYEASDRPTAPSEHANSSIAFDGDGRLYVLNTTLGIYRIDLGGGTAEEYSMPFPDLPPCVPDSDIPTITSECSPTRSDAPPIPNDIAFDAGGNAYVTDSTQATIWLVPRNPNTIQGTRLPTIWFQHPWLASDYIGVNGIRLNPERTLFFITVSTDLDGRSWVYTLPATDSSPKRDDMRVFHQYADGTLPDGIAFGHSGLLYVAIANPSLSGVSILKQLVGGDVPKGEEWRRLSNPAGSASYPYDSPANIAFNGKGSILVTNHAFATGAVNPDQFSVLDVFVGDKASPLEKPNLP